LPAIAELRVYGFGAELLAEVAPTLFTALEVAPVRVASRRAPLPYSKPLEYMCRVTTGMIAAAVRTILAANPRAAGPAKPAQQT